MATCTRVPGGRRHVNIFPSRTDCTWEEPLPALLHQRTLAAGAGEGGERPAHVVGTKFGSSSENEVSQQEVMEAETNWNIPIIRVRHAGKGQGQGAPSSPPEVASARTQSVSNLAGQAQAGRLPTEDLGRNLFTNGARKLESSL